ncbi:MAG: hypothetical protein ACN4GW_16045 [Desulforhopalus sp.]
MQKKKKTRVINILFLILCGAILIVLINAPEETTAPLPHDDTHERFHAIEGKKAAEKFCSACHEKNQVAPLPENHPPKYRCLFCHKRQQG